MNSYGTTKATLGAVGQTTEFGNRKQIALRLPAEVFLELKARAIKDGASMQEKMLDYIVGGLEVDLDLEEGK